MPPRRAMSASPVRVLNTLFAALVAAINRLDKSLDPRDSIVKLQRHEFTLSDSIYIFHAALAILWVSLWPLPLLFKIILPLLYILALLVPFTSQLLVPATPVISWVMAFFSSRFIPVEYRPSISVSLLPALESVLYGANISDILTRFTHPVLDILAWLPYGVLHFTLPVVVSIFLWLFRPKEVLHFWARAFGYMNLIGVLVQIVLPCAAPWYELIYGLTPATYAVHGSAGGLMRIDALFGGNGYQKTFASSPVVFGAFPSLHAGNATIEALFWSHFFPHMRTVAWAYAGVLYWATMYLTHHYLVDVVGGACLATACFYLFLPNELRGANATRGPGSIAGRTRSKHELYDLEVPAQRGTRAFGHSRGLSGKSLRLDGNTDTEGDSDGGASEVEEQDIAYRSPNPGTPNPGTPVPASAVPLINNNSSYSSQNGNGKKGGGHKHKHTASIASLTRGAGTEDEGWSPIGARGFAVPGTPSRLELGVGDAQAVKGGQRGS
ncbi:PAP2-domain-containing protein [Fomitiporia mediterranea MF3/22]|uniref:PAP2-domain-containing protein n=1 Tax=Fomitiporia mediterranea (strain MF3/22) TaxID=694068 RepID=UPI00044077F8|nr:PAP2-domain-containing protein [Fomitiporia mediterranea MF3/22]EJD00373.1 PAP2-domain-containing protein [Fomitiporia mediterranea MF3/22]